MVLSKKAGRAHDSGSSGSPPLLVTHGNSVLKQFTQLFRLVRVRRSLGCESVEGKGGGGRKFIHGTYVHVCVSQSESDRLRDGDDVVKKGTLCLNSSRT